MNQLKHIGIILDGNRRFAQKLNLPPIEGHKKGYDKIKELLDWCKEFNVKELTLYTFSVENFRRSGDEVKYLMKLFKKAFTELKNDKRIKDTKVNFIGMIRLFPKSIQKIMKELMEMTKTHTKFILNFAMGYGGRTEIIEAAKKIARLVKLNKLNPNNINENTFKKHLYISSEPDLIIRTSESRLSNFMTFQSAYSEIIFLPNKLWPEFSKQDFIGCLNEYSARQRRFGA